MECLFAERRGRGICVLGAGGHGKAVVAAIRAAGDVVEGVYDYDATRGGSEVLGARVRHTSALPTACRAVVAVGDNGARRRLAASRGAASGSFLGFPR